ncbi:MAG: hypothetical protein ACR2H2_13905 [Solirubrobacteraceae bacterium]
MSIFAANAGATVPAWVAVLIAVITGGGAVTAAVYAARAARERLQAELQARSEELQSERQARSEELNKQLRHERAMRVRDEYRTALDDAAVIGVRFRERLATAVREVEGSEQVPAGTVRPLVLDREDLIELRGAEARLILRFGAEHEATVSFQAFHEVVIAGVNLVRKARAAGTDSPISTGTRSSPRQAREAYVFRGSGRVSRLFGVGRVVMERGAAGRAWRVEGGERIVA